MTWPKNLTPTVAIAVAALFTGGLGGAIFTWWVNQEEPTLITYSISRTDILANEQVRSLIPDLSLKIGDKDVSELYIHNIEIGAERGSFSTPFAIAIRFANAAFYGFKATAPSPLHKIDCNMIPEGLLCTLQPLDTRRISVPRSKEIEISFDAFPFARQPRYGISIASAFPSLPEVNTTSNVAFVNRADYTSTTNRSAVSSWLIAIFVASVFSILTFQILSAAKKKPTEPTAP